MDLRLFHLPHHLHCNTIQPHQWFPQPPLNFPFLHLHLRPHHLIFNLAAGRVCHSLLLVIKNHYPNPSTSSCLHLHLHLRRFLSSIMAKTRYLLLHPLSLIRRAICTSPPSISKAFLRNPLHQLMRTANGYNTVTQIHPAFEHPRRIDLT